ncbi:hypothetical protein BV22DRAFT_1094986 [Leucogyrophana mollusca]|uniref:Uncharacterized protein n=1 Tax=Leucogyrophana mollusca TaxID=85980 RepID=A0ACB8B9A7_9AGAM|nr:hypothetical protein BV22DRAFT_1094986 [Leucogyrophana mollusca]
MSHHRGHSNRANRYNDRNAYYEYPQDPYDYDNDAQYGPYSAGLLANQPYPYHNSYTNHGGAQISYSTAFNYWRGVDPYPANPYQHDSPYGYNSTGSSYSTNDSYRAPPRRRSASPQREYHTHADATSASAPLLVRPSFRKKRDSDTSTDPLTMSASPPPPENPPPLPSAPSPSYISLSLQPSEPLTDPSSSRKLLILDLNGTLLIRSQHGSKNRYAPVPGGGPPNGPMPRLRAVQPRPYIPAFRAYLFAPETKTWLDTMVWSSAQPHSVTDMVDKVFGDKIDELKAVWDRESLGLAKQDYFRKTQTTKDLTKPWKLLPLNSNPATLSSHDASPPPSHSTSAGATSPLAHSALTTLLLDDSPLKARLQPYNHVCIPEYSAPMRARDLRTLELEKLRNTTMPRVTKAASIAEDSRDAETTKLLQALASKRNPVRITTEATDPKVASLSEPQTHPADAEIPPAPMGKKRKRKAKLQKADVTAIADAEDQKDTYSDSDLSARSRSTSIENLSTPERGGPSDARSSPNGNLEEESPEEPYDATLLAVIGILDEIKSQSSVAGWIRSRRLWVSPPKAEVTPRSGATEVLSAPQLSDTSNAVEEPPKKETDKQHRRLEKKRRKREEKAAVRNASESRNPEGIPAQAEATKVGNDATTSTVVTETTPAVFPSASADEEPESDRMWFSDSRTLAYWVARGRRALGELGIEAVHGVTG